MESGWRSWLARLRGLTTGALAFGCVLGCAEAQSDFDAARAFRDLRAQVEIGPRPSGSPGAVRTRQLIRERVEAAGWIIEEQPFAVTRSDGQIVSMTNLVATRPGASDELLLLGAHYDTKDIPGVRFVGANDGASGVSVLLELARALGPEPGPLTLRLVFFDGEEAFGASITQEDGLYGSREYAQRMAQRGELARVRALVLFDMVADRDLNLAIDSRSSSKLRDMLESVSDRLVDPSHRLTLVDDHLPFVERGVTSVLALIDFQFGARRSPGPLWHTAQDDLTAVSEDSLKRVGHAAVELVRRLETPEFASRRDGDRQASSSEGADPR